MDVVYVLIGHYESAECLSRSKVVGVYKQLKDARDKMNEVFNKERANYESDAEFYMHNYACSIFDGVENFTEFRIVECNVQ